MRTVLIVKERGIIRVVKNGPERISGTAISPVHMVTPARMMFAPEILASVGDPAGSRPGLTLFYPQTPNGLV